MGFNPYLKALEFEADSPYQAARLPDDCSLKVFIFGEIGQVSIYSESLGIPIQRFFLVDDLDNFLESLALVSQKYIELSGEIRLIQENQGCLLQQTNKGILKVSSHISARLKIYQALVDAENCLNNSDNINEIVETLKQLLALAK